MKVSSRFAAQAILIILTACLCDARVEAANVCSAQAMCTEVSSFAATVSDFRTSISGNNRIANATVRLSNKTNRPLVLGYVDRSGVVIDELGNRYAIDTRDTNNVRAIGVITNRTFDPKFTLQPGESSDARFQFSWYAGNKPAGTRFQLELTIREIDSADNQMKLGREHVVQFANLTDGAGSTLTQAVAPAATAAASSDAPAAAAVPPAAPVDACAGQTQCYDAGAFTASVSQVTTSQSGNNQHVRLNVRFRNVSAAPLILAYQKNSGTMIDEHGNRYTIDSRYSDRVKGIGLVEPNRADPQFVLRPGEARDASFEFSRYVGAKGLLGTVFAPDLAIEQLEILSSQQVRSLREYSVSYRDLRQGSWALGAGEPNSAIEALNNVSEGLRSLFKKKQK